MDASQVEKKRKRKRKRKKSPWVLWKGSLAIGRRDSSWHGYCDQCINEGSPKVCVGYCEIGPY